MHGTAGLCTAPPARNHPQQETKARTGGPSASPAVPGLQYLSVPRVSWSLLCFLRGERRSEWCPAGGPSPPCSTLLSGSWPPGPAAPAAGGAGRVPTAVTHLRILICQSRLASRSTKTMKRKTTTAVRPTSQGCSTLGPVPAWQGDGGEDRDRDGDGCRQTPSCRRQDAPSYGTES